MKLTEEHEQIRSTIKKFVESEINPYVDEWEEAELFPAHEVFKKRILFIRELNVLTAARDGAFFAIKHQVVDCEHIAFDLLWTTHDGVNSCHKLVE